MSECLHVYLINSGVLRLLQNATKRAHPVRVLEIGFGTGMSCLLTMAVALAYQCPLEYHSIEHQLLSADVLAQLQIQPAIDRVLQQQGIATTSGACVLEDQWLAFCRQLTECDQSTCPVWNASEQVSLHLILDEARNWLADRASHCDGIARDGIAQSSNQCAQFDAIYFDAFSPATNPELWTVEVYEKVKQLLVSGGRLVSYCVNGQVRRGLIEAGFQVDRLPGPPGGKREVLVATRFV